MRKYRNADALTWDVILDGLAATHHPMWREMGWFAFEGWAA
jgi:hypothetical protein